MRNKKIGHIILKGGTIKDIQKEIPDFPDEVTIAYFIKLGYAESTAKNYYSWLNKNAKLADMHDTSGTTAEAERNNINTNIISSENANFDNILVDTCALGYNETVNIIETATQVTFIHSTLREMDDKKNLNKKAFATSQEKTLAYNIRLYTEKVLENPDKFLLSSFSGYKEYYVDDILLQYLLILPKQIRPTLLTADKNLAARAKAHSLEFILKTNSASSETSNSLGSVSCVLPRSTLSMSSSLPVHAIANASSKTCAFRLVKKYGFGLKLFTDGTSYYIFTEIPQQLTIILTSGESIPYKKDTSTLVNPGDTVCVHIKSKGTVTDYKYKIKK
jgi:hypothetical protein